MLYGTAGDLSAVAEPELDGLVPVGSRHVVQLHDLSPGTTYEYEAVATRVVKLKAYWPDMGLDVRSGPHRFTTLDRDRPSVSFSVITDTHEDTTALRLNRTIDWDSTEFLVHLGDAFDWVDSEDQLSVVAPSDLRRPRRDQAALLRPRQPRVRGPFARHVHDYVPTPEGGSTTPAMPAPCT